jgi:type I site-specific restriction endonuclease
MSEALNKSLFNDDTVDRVIFHLMEKGIKVNGGDKIGKTIIFAMSTRHADYILKRINARYPEYAGKIGATIYNGIKYVDTLIEDFSTKEKSPQIAISVDMLDTGIDIPEIVNLVFFKKVRSKAKFWQMIGRGTRLCEDLFGVGQHKKSFRIFDYCCNFEFFRVNPNGIQANIIKPLTECLFNIRLAMFALRTIIVCEPMPEANVSNSFSNIGLILVFVRRANIRFAPTLVLLIGLILVFVRDEHKVRPTRRITKYLLRSTRKFMIAYLI